MALGDQAGKAAVDDLLAKLPGIEDYITQRQQALMDRIDALEAKIENFGNQVVGGVLADLTAERQQLVSDIHGVIDRINLPQIIKPRATEDGK